MKRLKRWIEKQLYIPKHEKENYKSLTRLVAPSVFGLLLCAVCLSVLTWAWFTDQKGVDVESISIASIDANVIIESVEAVPAQEEGAAENAVLAANELGAANTVLAANEVSYDGGYTLAAGSVHTVTLETYGDASSGYCVVTLGDGTYHTPAMAPGESLKFTVDCTYAEADVHMTVTAYWLTDSVYGDNELIDGAVITFGEAPEPSESPAPTESTEPTDSTESPAPTEPVEPTNPVEPTEPTESPVPTESPAPSPSTEPSPSPDTTESPAPSESPAPTESPAPSESPAPTESPDPSASPEPAESPEPEAPAEPAPDEGETQPGDTEPSPPAEP